MTQLLARGRGMVPRWCVLPALVAGGHFLSGSCEPMLSVRRMHLILGMQLRMVYLGRQLSVSQHDSPIKILGFPCGFLLNPPREGGPNPILEHPQAGTASAQEGLQAHRQVRPVDVGGCRLHCDQQHEGAHSFFSQRANDRNPKRSVRGAWTSPLRFRFGGSNHDLVFTSMFCKFPLEDMSSEA